MHIWTPRFAAAAKASQGHEIAGLLQAGMRRPPEAHAHTHACSHPYTRTPTTHARAHTCIHTKQNRAKPGATSLWHTARFNHGPKQRTWPLPARGRCRPTAPTRSWSKTSSGRRTSGQSRDLETLYPRAHTQAAKAGRGMKCAPRLLQGTRNAPAYTTPCSWAGQNRRRGLPHSKPLTIHARCDSPRPPKVTNARRPARCGARNSFKHIHTYPCPLLFAKRRRGLPHDKMKETSPDSSSIHPQLSPLHRPAHKSSRGHSGQNTSKNKDYMERGMGHGGWGLSLRGK